MIYYNSFHSLFQYPYAFVELAKSMVHLRPSTERLMSLRPAMLIKVASNWGKDNMGLYWGNINVLVILG